MRTIGEIHKKLFNLNCILYKQKAHLGKGMSRTLAMQIEITKSQIKLIQWILNGKDDLK